MSRKIKIRTLDAIVSERLLERPFVLKIDVEGAEFEVLLGTSNTLSDVNAIIIKINMDDRYDAMEYNTYRIDYLLHSFGFGLFAILDVDMSANPRIVKKADFLYVKNKIVKSLANF